jgi:hypothetical protein
MAKAKAKASGKTSIEVTIPVVTVSESNVRDRGRHGKPGSLRKSQRVKSNRTVSGYTMRAQIGRSLDVWPAGVPLVVTLTRVGGRKMDDDNLSAALKAVRDGVADWLGVDDGSPLLTWDYRQEPDPKNRSQAVRCRVELVK